MISTVFSAHFLSRIRAPNQGFPTTRGEKADSRFRGRFLAFLALFLAVFQLESPINRCAAGLSDWLSSHESRFFTSVQAFLRSFAGMNPEAARRSRWFGTTGKKIRSRTRHLSPGFGRESASAAAISRA